MDSQFETQWKPATGAILHRVIEFIERFATRTSASHYTDKRYLLHGSIRPSADYSRCWTWSIIEHAHKEKKYLKRDKEER